MCLITVFTPSFNRAKLLIRLFESLVNQYYLNFEWLIVDDGSIDNTQELVEQFQEKANFKVRYLYQSNQGKHFALNKGVQNADGKLFFILDSDDILPNNALELIALNYEKIKDINDVAGVAGRKAFFNGDYIGSKKMLDQPTLLSVFEFRYKLNFEGDMCEVFYTDILKQFPFPEFNQEKFCPEALVWNRIGKNYILYWINDIIYNAEYQVGGLTDKIIEIRKNSPIATTTYYSELEKAPIPFISKLKANINYWRFAFYLKKGFIEKVKQANIIYSMIGFPLGTLMFLKDNIKGK